mgnify:CR=1 FL=1
MLPPLIDFMKIRRKANKSLTKQEYWMSSPGGSHVDATLATEQAILRDLYARKILKQQQQQQQVETPWWKDPFGFTIK